MNKEFKEGPVWWSLTLGGRGGCDIVFEKLAEASPGCSMSGEP